MGSIQLSESSLYQDECVLIALVLGAYALWALIAWLRRSRPDLRIGWPVAAAFVLRLIAAAALGSLSIGSQLRGGDENTFLLRAQELLNHPLGSSASLDKLSGELHTWLFSLNLRVFNPDPPELMLRVEMITFASATFACCSVSAWLMSP